METFSDPSSTSLRFIHHFWPSVLKLDLLAYLLGIWSPQYVKLGFRESLGALSDSTCVAHLLCLG